MLLLKFSKLQKEVCCYAKRKVLKNGQVSKLSKKEKRKKEKYEKIAHISIKSFQVSNKRDMFQGA
jgi:hypothetical protein